MTRLLVTKQPIRVQLDHWAHPVRFTWRNVTYRVQEIQQTWQVDTDWWHEAGHVWRDYWAVTTQEGLFCVLYYDHLDQCWYLSRAYD